MIDNSTIYYNDCIYTHPDDVDIQVDCVDYRDLPLVIRMMDAFNLQNNDDMKEVEWNV